MKQKREFSVEKCFDSYWRVVENNKAEPLGMFEAVDIAATDSKKVEIMAGGVNVYIRWNEDDCISFRPDSCDTKLEQGEKIDVYVNESDGVLKIAIYYDNKDAEKPDVLIRIPNNLKSLDVSSGDNIDYDAYTDKVEEISFLADCLATRDIVAKKVNIQARKTKMIVSENTDAHFFIRETRAEIVCGAASAFSYGPKTEGMEDDGTDIAKICYGGRNEVIIELNDLIGRPKIDLLS